jgi:hypothetical protein
MPALEWMEWEDPNNRNTRKRIRKQKSFVSQEELRAYVKKLQQTDAFIEVVAGD